MAIRRRNFQGVRNILSFNRHFYIAGIAILLLLIIACKLLAFPSLYLTLIVLAFSYGLLMPLIVSAYIYDLSGFYRFDWLDKIFPVRSKPVDIININAGFDETSFIIQDKFPESTIRVFDFYDAKRHTEPAIKRARKVSITYPDTRQIKSDQIPPASGTADIIFLISAIHEIRTHDEKVIFLKECCRLCRRGGKVVMVEHLRDFANFLAFTVGFTHFFSGSEWKKAFLAAGLHLVKEEKFTPFMSIFTCEP